MSRLRKSTMSNVAVKVVTLALGVAGLSVQKAHAVDVVVGGNIQIINLLNVNPQLGLDFTSNGTNITVATFTISNNTAQFDLNLSFLNGGGFISSAGQEVDMTAITLGPEGTGTLGTGANVLIPGAAAGAATFTTGGDLTLQVAGAGPDAVVWDAGSQTTATTGYVLELLGTWLASTNLAGLYTETITATLVATL